MKTPELIQQLLKLQPLLMVIDDVSISRWSLW